MARTAEALVRAPTGLPRSRRRYCEGAESLATHVARLGAMPHLGSQRRRTVDLIEHRRAQRTARPGRQRLSDRDEDASRREGRGPRVVIANGSEGEPASAKDAWLLTNRPHLVLDGAVLAAEAVDASDVVVAIDRPRASCPDDGRPRARGTARRAEAMRSDVRVVDLPSRYVAGEESALVHWVNGGDAKPTFVPPRPFERGVRGRATLIQNVETLSHLALIARFGPDWFRELGTATEPGTAIVTLGGAVASPGVCEIAIGTHRRATSSPRPEGRPTEIAAFLIGGYFGTWIPADGAWDLALGHIELGRVGAAFGCGVVYALPAGVCGLAETARVARYLAEESAGQCGPCVYGLAAIADALDAIVAGRDGRAHDRARSDAGPDRSPGGARATSPTARSASWPARSTHSPTSSSATAAGVRAASARRRCLLPLPDADDREWGWR